MNTKVRLLDYVRSMSPTLLRGDQEAVPELLVRVWQRCLTAKRKGQRSYSSLGRNESIPENPSRSMSVHIKALLQSAFELRRNARYLL
jgi:hypothetical protein